MSATATAAPPGWFSRFFAGLQRVGRSFMLPVAVLPAAGILLRFGLPDMLGKYHEILGMMAVAGEALLTNLPILFALGVAIGFTRRADATIGIAALVGYLVFDRVTRSMFAVTELFGQSLADQVLIEPGAEAALVYPRPNPTGVLGGVLVGLLASVLYTRFHRVKLVPWLAFFGGRRFVPIVTAFASLLLAIVMGYLWIPIGQAIDYLGNQLYDAAAVGAGIYGILNRLLIPFGLHHIINSLIWFTFGNFETPGGEAVTGDLNAYLQGAEGAGGFEAGFYPIMMFALPAAALAFWWTAHPSRRAATGGFMLSVALTSLVTGITEPIEFAFVFIAPALYVIHAVLTGVSLFIAQALGIKMAFTFSAGLTDYVLFFGKANTENPLLLIPLGLAFGVIYFFLFSWVIRRFNLATPGREPEGAESAVTDVLADDTRPREETRTGAVAQGSRSGAGDGPQGQGGAPPPSP